MPAAKAPAATAKPKEASVTAPEVKTKAHITVDDVLPGLIFGTLFTLLALIEYRINAAAVKAADPMQYFYWLEFKTTDPVISTLLLALSPLLFIAIFQVSVAFVRTFTHKAPAVVHLYDVINFIALGSVVHAVFGYIGPLDAVIKAAGAELAKDASASVAKTQLADAVTKQSLPLLEVLVSNVIMLFLPLFRLKEANKAAQQQLGTAVGASKKDD